MLQQSTLQFLAKLEKNNNKPWFDTNRDKYDNAKADMEQLSASVIEKFGVIDADIAPLPAKKTMFRINRDIRFSNNKTPYKTNLAASFDKGGKKSGFAGYYLHVQPGDRSMIAGGLWMPDAPMLKKIRQEIDYCFPEFKKIIHAPAFKKHFGTLEISDSTSLKREPKGYEKENPAITYLKLTSFITSKKLTDEEVHSPKFLADIVTSFKALMPFVYFLNRAIGEPE